MFSAGGLIKDPPVLLFLIKKNPAAEGFDISDTHEARFAKPVPTWKVLPEFEESITETLENAFGELEDKTEFGYALLSAAKTATVVQDSVTKVEMHNVLRETPKTGDTRMPGLWLGIATISALGATTFFYLSNKKRRNER